MIFPERVFGRSSAKWIAFGRASLPILSATCSRSSAASSSPPAFAALGRDEGDDRLAGVLVGSADHRRLGDLSCETSADSTSIVERRWPETLITSSIRPTIQK